MSSNDHLARITTFIQQNPHMRFVAPSTSDYKALREAYILNTGFTPLGIVRPQSASDVAALIKLCTTHHIPFTVRSGGHDLFGRCFATDALAIDMRSINHVHIDEKNLIAKIGGGILVGDLAKALAEKSLAAPMGSIGDVGYVGWATHGGYGQFGSNYGLGVDGILGAKIADAQGNVVDAGEGMLMGIRGGGGFIGVVVEMTIRLARLKKVLAGVLLYESSDMTKTISAFNSGYDSLNLPAPLGIQRSVINIPGMGKCFIAGFLWSSPNMDEGQEVLEQLKALHPTIHVDVKQQSIPEWQAATGARIPKTAYARDNIVSIERFTDSLNAVVGKHAALMSDDPATLFSIHELRAESRSCSASLGDSSVFPNRMPHVFVEFIASSSTPEGTKEVWDWACKFKSDMEDVARKEGILQEKKYVSLTPPEEFDGEKMFGEKWEVLKGLKRRFDPRNVFEKAVVTFEKGSK